MHEQPTKFPAELSQKDLNEKLLEKFRKAAENKGLNSEATEYFLGLVDELIAIRGDKTDAQLSDPDNVEAFGKYSDKMKEIFNLANEKKLVLEIDVGEYNRIHYVDQSDGEVFVIMAKEDGLLACIDEKGNQIGPDLFSTGAMHRFNGEITLEAVKSNKKEVMINHKGEELGGEYEHIDRFYDTADKMFFMAQKENGMDVIVNSEGVEIGGDFSYVKQHLVCRGKTVFHVRKGDILNAIMDENGDIVSKTPEDSNLDVKLGDFSRMEVIDDELYYNAYVSTPGRTLMNEDGPIRRMRMMNEGGPVSKEFDYVSSPCNANGKLFFKAITINGAHIVVDKDGTSVGGNFYRVSNKLIAVGSSVAFDLRQRNGDMLVYNGKTNRFSDAFHSVTDITNIGDEIFFIGDNEDNEISAVIDENNIKVGGEFKEIEEMRDIGGKLAFLAVAQDNTMCIIDSHGKIVGGKYELCQKPLDMNGKIVFRAIADSGQWVLVHEDYQKPIGGEFNEINDPEMIGDAMFFIAQNLLGKWCIVNGSGEIIVDDLKASPYLFNRNNKMYASVYKEDFTHHFINESGKTLFSSTEVVGNIISTGEGIVFVGLSNDLRWGLFDENGRFNNEEYSEEPFITYLDGKLIVVAERDGKVVKETYFIK